MGILSWIFLGLFAGVLAKYFMSSEEEGWIFTIVLGIAGAFTGGFLGSFVGIGSVSGFDLRSLALATVGAAFLLFVGRLVRKKA